MRAAVLVVVMLGGGPAAAGEVEVALSPWVTASLPAEVVAAPLTPELSGSWVLEASGVEIIAAPVSLDDDTLDALALARRRWPEFGGDLAKSFAPGFEQLLASGGVRDCTWVWRPIANDEARLLSAVGVRFTCSEGATTAHAVLLAGLHGGGQTVVRVASLAGEAGPLEVATGLLASWTPSRPYEPRTFLGLTWRLRDYSRGRLEFVAGELMGGFLGAAMFVWLLTALLIGWGFGPNASVAVSVVLLNVLGLVGYEHDGVVEWPWLTMTLPTTVLGLALLGPARERWTAKWGESA